MKEDIPFLDTPLQFQMRPFIDHRFFCYPILSEVIPRASLRCTSIQRLSPDIRLGYRGLGCFGLSASFLFFYYSLQV